MFKPSRLNNAFIGAVVFVVLGVPVCNAQIYKCRYIDSTNNHSTTATYDLREGGKDLATLNEDPKDWHGRFLDLGAYYLSILKVTGLPSPFPKGALATQKIKIVKKTGVYTSDTEYTGSDGQGISEVSDIHNSGDCERNP